MRLLADLNIARRTVDVVRSLGHDVVRVDDVMPATSTDAAIVAEARHSRRVILTQDLDFSAIVALSGETAPSVVSLRLGSSRIEHVNARLAQVLITLERDVQTGVIVTVEDGRVRLRALPIT